MLLPFYIRLNTLNDIRVSKSFALIFLSSVSVMLFGSGRLALAAGISFWIYFIPWNFYSMAGVESVHATIGGLLILSQLLSRKNRLHAKTVYAFLSATCLLTSFFFIANYYGINPYNLAAKIPYPVGPLGQETLSGALIAATLPACFANKKTLAIIPFAAIGLYLANSTTSYVAAGLSLVYLGFQYKKSFFFLLPYAVALIVLVAFLSHAQDGFNPHGRLDAWKDAWNMWVEAPLWRKVFGFGLGYYWDNSRALFMGEPFRHAHSEIIQLLPELGLFGVFTFLFLVRAAFVGPGDAIARSGFLALFTNSFANFTFHLAPLSLVAIIYYVLTLKTGGIKNGYNCNTDV